MAWLAAHDICVEQRLRTGTSMLILLFSNNTLPGGERYLESKRMVAARVRSYFGGGNQSSIEGLSTASRRSLKIKSLAHNKRNTWMLGSSQSCCMTDLREIFAELGIPQYLQDFLDQGFDTWDTILDITESDFDALGVKLGHRRKLQRKIANSRGLSPDRALASPSRNTPSDTGQTDDHSHGGSKSEPKDGGSGSHGAKRKYRRHPKPDENAPERPPSAYVIFSNKMREDLKGRNLSFTEIAKLVGENWQNLTPAEKEPYEQQAFSAKERYNNELAEYKQTNQYKEYSQYLVEFKARQSNQQQGT